MFFPSYEFADVNRPRKHRSILSVTRTCEVCQQPFRTIGETRHCSTRCERFEAAHFGRSYLALILYQAREYHHA